MFPLPTSPLALSTCSPSRPWPPPRRWLGSSRRPRPRPPSQVATDVMASRMATLAPGHPALARLAARPRSTPASRVTPVPRACAARAAVLASGRAEPKPLRPFLGHAVRLYPDHAGPEPRRPCRSCPRERPNHLQQHEQEELPLMNCCSTTIDWTLGRPDLALALQNLSIYYF